MIRKLFLSIIIVALFPWAVSAQGDTGVQARVLPANTEFLLEIIDWSYEYISDTNLRFNWQSNLPGIGKIEFGETWLKGQEILTEEESVQHSILLKDLEPGALYYFNLSVFNDSDSVSLGDNTFVTGGQRKVLDSNRVLHKIPDESAVGASKKIMEIDPYPEVGAVYNSDELFLLEDLSVLFIIFSFLLVLFLLYKKLREKNEEKGKHWEKLDK